MAFFPFFLNGFSSSQFGKCPDEVIKHCKLRNSPKYLAECYSIVSCPQVFFLYDLCLNCACYWENIETICVLFVVRVFTIFLDTNLDNAGMAIGVSCFTSTCPNSTSFWVGSIHCSSVNVVSPKKCVDGKVLKLLAARVKYILINYSVSQCSFHVIPLNFFLNELDQVQPFP